MAIQMKCAGFLFILLILAELSFAAPVIHEANFYRTFDGKDYYGTGLGQDFNLQLSTMSNDGEVVAFYGSNEFDGEKHMKLFVHNFESTSEPVEVTLPATIGFFNTNAGLVSNADGSRIFFIARSKETTSSNLFCMVNTLTGAVTVLLEAVQSIIEYPQDIATDAAGDYLYFNETDNGDRGDLWRIQTSGGAWPELVIDANTIGHPSGGVGRFIDQFDISDDGETIAFFIEGRIATDTSVILTNKELFVKTDSGIRFLTNNDENSKKGLVISGDASTIVYTADYSWMVTTPDAVVESQIHIEPGYHSCGERPGISRDGSMIFACSTPNGVSSPHGYLIKTDGTSRRMVEPKQFNMRGTFEGLHLSDDGTRVFFKNRDYVYPDGWYNMTAGVFGANLWPAQVPKVTSVSYPQDMFNLLENNERFEIEIGVSDPQGDVAISNVKEYLLFPEGYNAYHYGPITIGMNTTPSASNLYTAWGGSGSAWPDREPILTARFSVEDVDGNVSYADTLVQPPAIPGDVDRDGIVTLLDAVAALKVLSGLDTAVNRNADVNRDDAIGMAEAVYVMQKAGGLRE